MDFLRLTIVIITCYMASNKAAAELKEDVATLVTRLNALQTSQLLVHTMVIRTASDLSNERDRRVILESKLAHETEKRKLLEASQLELKKDLVEESEKRTQLEASQHKLQTRLAHETEDRVLLTNRIQGLQQGLSYEKNRRGELENQFTEQKEALQHQVAMLQKAVEKIPSKMILHGSWSPWSFWSECTKTCGNGQRKRTRTCTNPPPINGGRPCAGRDQEIDNCNSATCLPVHGSWSPWSFWSECTKTGGNGQRKRTRTCTNPPPINGGRQCAGRDQEIDNYNSATCLPVLRRVRSIIGNVKGSGKDQFSSPLGVVVSPAGGRFYVADAGNDRVVIYSDEGVFIGTFGSEGKGDGQFNHPSGIAVNSQEEVIVSEWYNPRISVFGRDGQFKYTFGKSGTSNGQFNSSYGVAVDRSDNMYISDYGNHRVQEFTPTGEFIRQFGRKGSAPGELSYPSYLAVAANTGRVYVADSNNHRVSVFSSSGEFIFTFGTKGTANGQIQYPEGIAIDDQGFVFLCDSGNHRIQVFHANGTFISAFGIWGSKSGQFNSPTGLAIMHNGDVIVVDNGNNRIQIVSK